jgi:hypothetical protein
MPTVESLLKDNVTLKVECIDRLYLNGYVPRLQRPQNLWWFLHAHRGCPVISPVLVKRLTDDFVRKIERFAEANAVPVVAFDKCASKEAIAQKMLEAFEAAEGVVMIGVAQEKISSFRSYQKDRGQPRRPGQPPCYAFYRGPVNVNQYYFYILDRDFGLCFIKFSSYVPFTVRVWVNGHEWAKRQLEHQGVRYEALDNGFLACDDPEALQTICDSFSVEHIEAFFRKWLRQLPHPFTAEDREAGFRYDLSILQLEMSTTQVFDKPLSGRLFFEQVIRENLDIGRPDQVSLIFDRRITRRTPGRFRTRVLTAGVTPSLRFDYKATKVKQYFKLERALRTETTINNANDFRVGKLVKNLDRLRVIGRNVNHRLLSLECVAQDCAIASQTVERVVLPTVDEDERRAPALRWGDPRVMALFSAICSFATAPEGFTNRSLRQRVAMLHDPGPAGYAASRMSYDLRRLRANRIVVRVPKSHRYMLTAQGRRIALFMTKSYVRVVRPIFQRLDPQLPEDTPGPLRSAWKACEVEIDKVVAEARLAA